MEKILTISIAAYNVSEYIEQTLSSLVASKHLNKLDVIVVNDGSKDNTLEVAKKFEIQYPESIKVVDKENGGYGTTFNKSISLAKGKYFKMLDGDDWYNSEQLDLFIEKLSNEDSDLVITDYSKFYESDQSYKLYKVNGIDNNKKTKLSDCVELFGLGIWGITYKTSILRESGLELPGGIPYTDVLYSTIPMKLVDDIIYYPLNIYQYRIGREGQTVSRESWIRNTDVFINLSLQLVDFYEKNKLTKNSIYLKNRIYDYCMRSFKIILLDLENNNCKNKLMNYDLNVKKISPEIYKSMEIGNVKKIGYFIKITRMLNYMNINLMKILNIRISNLD